MCWIRLRVGGPTGATGCGVGKRRGRGSKRALSTGHIIGWLTVRRKGRRAMIRRLAQMGRVVVADLVDARLSSTYGTWCVSMKGQRDLVIDFL